MHAYIISAASGEKRERVVAQRGERSKNERESEDDETEKKGQTKLAATTTTMSDDDDRRSIIGQQKTDIPKCVQQHEEVLGKREREGKGREDRVFCTLWSVACVIV